MSATVNRGLSGSFKFIITMTLILVVILDQIAMWYPFFLNAMKYLKWINYLGFISRFLWICLLGMFIYYCFVKKYSSLAIGSLVLTLLYLVSVFGVKLFYVFGWILNPLAEYVLGALIFAVLVLFSSARSNGYLIAFSLIRLLLVTSAAIILSRMGLFSTGEWLIYLFAAIELTPALLIPMFVKEPKREINSADQVINCK